MKDAPLIVIRIFSNLTLGDAEGFVGLFLSKFTSSVGP